MDGELNNLYARVKDDPLAREKLLRIAKPQITRTASGIAGRLLDWENDDELSISLIAFNEAIDTFDISKGKSFWGYANLVIKHRLIDYFRKEASWKQRIALIEEGKDINPEFLQKEAEMAWQNLRQEEEAEARAEMVVSFEEAIRQFGFTLKDLIKSSPKHRDTRTSLLKIAMALIKERELLAQALASKQLPIKELMLLTGQKRKVLERGRRYLIALVLIMSLPEFSPMKDLLQLPEEVRG